MSKMIQKQEIVKDTKCAKQNRLSTIMPTKQEKDHIYHHLDKGTQQPTD